MSPFIPLLPISPKPALIDSTGTTSLSSRRKIISSIGLVTTGLLASSLCAEASWAKDHKKDLPVVKVQSRPQATYLKTAPSQQIGGLPDEWVRLQGSNLRNYAYYLNSLKMRNISAQDVIEAHAKQHGSVWNMLPPKQWWTRMGYTLRVVDRISSEMRVPIKEIVSAYRTPTYNSRCSGAKKQSWHQANIAVDVKFDTSARNVTRAARTLRDRGLFKGGVGSYYSFTHIDTRGVNVNW